MQSIASKYDLKINDSLVDPYDENKEAEYTVRKGKSELYLYRVYIYLSGIHSALVDYVVYEFHPTVNPQTLKVNRTLNNQFCKTELMLWGTFDMKALVTMKSGERVELHHTLGFDKQLRSKSGLKLKLV